MVGRKPKPAALHRLHGFPSKGGKSERALRAREPIPPDALGAAPDWLTPEQQDLWQHVIACAPHGILKQLDAGCLIVWVCAASLHRHAATQIALHGTTIETSNGTIVQSPHVGMMNRAGAAMLRAGEQLGFSPTSRPRLATATSSVIPDSYYRELDRTHPLPRGEKHVSLEEFLANAPT